MHVSQGVGTQGDLDIFLITRCRTGFAGRFTYAAAISFPAVGLYLLSRKRIRIPLVTTRVVPQASSMKSERRCVQQASDCPPNIAKLRLKGWDLLDLAAKGATSRPPSP